MIIDHIKKAIVDLDEDLTIKLVNQSLSQKVDPLVILSDGLIAGMKRVGELFAKKEYFVPEVLIASDAFYRGFNRISLLIAKKEKRVRGKVVIGVVEGDIHDIGKNIVKVMIEAAGFEVVDLGKDVQVKEFIEAVQKERPDILAISSLMTTTMVRMAGIIGLLKKKGLRDSVRVIVGGAPLSREYAEKIGADGYGADAAEAVRVVEGFVGANP
ncbi:MAG TPA: cobalamin-binding protein [bacterium (Candidatus Stahlbacteria)]|nr:cobalamin-binding protein [Candidatus Stahlbacteria bacterium]